ncbi:cytochrome P450 [Streptomyces violaceusniger]
MSWTELRTLTPGSPPDRWRAVHGQGSVFRADDGSGRSAWVVARHADVKAALADVHRFGSQEGIRLGSDAGAVSTVRGKTLLVSDPPRHTALRRAFMPLFSGSALAEIEQGIGAIADETVRSALRREVCDFSGDVAAAVATHAVSAVLGAPSSADPGLVGLTADAVGDDDSQASEEANSELFMHSAQLLDEILTSDQTATATAIRSAVDVLGFEDVLVNLHGFFLAAIETTRYAAAGALHFMIDQGAGVGDVLAHWDMARGVEEVLRWTSPGVYVMRTVTHDTTWRDTDLRSGERIILWLAAANVDATVFDRPDGFDAARWPNPHVTFGVGHHRCIGERLARMELRALLTTLQRWVESAELVDAPTLRSHDHLRGIHRMPVRLSAWSDDRRRSSSSAKERLDSDA